MKILIDYLTSHPVHSARGAPHGAAQMIGETIPPLMHLVPLPMVDGDYDPSGVYWGSGNDDIGDMWAAFDEAFTTLIRVRAMGTADAAAKVRREIRAAQGDRDAADALFFHIHGDRTYSTDTTDLSRWMASEIVPPGHPRLEAEYLEAVRFTEGEQLGETCAMVFAPAAHTDVTSSIDEFADLIARVPGAAQTIFTNPEAWQVIGSLAHDIWLTRNRHGAGFWDRGHGEADQMLTHCAHLLGERDVYRGDDGLIYFGV
jgi:hypothetical protein